MARADLAFGEGEATMLLPEGCGIKIAMKVIGESTLEMRAEAYGPLGSVADTHRLDLEAFAPGRAWGHEMRAVADVLRELLARVLDTCSRYGLQTTWREKALLRGVVTAILPDFAPEVDITLVDGAFHLADAKSLSEGTAGRRWAGAPTEEVADHG